MAQEVKIDVKFKVIEDINKNLKKMNSNFSSIEKQKFGNLKSTFEKLSMGALGINQALELAKKGFTVAKAAIGGFISEASKIEDISTQFETLTGSTNNAKILLQDLQQFAAKTPFKIEGLANASKKLLSFGFAQEEIITRLTQLGDVAAASGNDINDLSLVFGQVQAAGKLTGERLLQFQERAIPIGPALAKTMGVAEEAVKGLVSEGKVTFEVFDKAFKTLTEEGGQFANGMVRQSKTLSGLLSTLGDNFSLLQAQIGQKLLPIIKKIVTAFINFIQVNKDLIATKATEYIKGFVRGIGSLAKGVAAVTPFLFGFANIFEIIANVILEATIGVLKFARSAAKLIDLIPGVDGVASGVNDTVELFTLALEASNDKLKESAKKFANFEEKANSAGESIQNFSRTISAIPEVKAIKLEVKPLIQEVKEPLTIQIKAAFGEIATRIAGLFEFKNIGTTIKTLGSAFKGGAKNFITTVTGTVAKLFGNTKIGIIAQIVTAIVEVFGQAPEKFRKMIIDIFKELPGLIADIIVNIYSLSDIVGEATVELIDRLPEMIDRIAEAWIERFTDPYFMSRISLAISIALARAIPRAVDSFIKGITSGFGNILTKWEDSFKEVGDFFQDIGQIFKDASDKFKGAVDFFEGIVKDIKSGGPIGSAGKDFFGGVKSFVGGIGSSFGFAKGGDVPDLSRFANDRFPARLSAGESVISASTSDRLKDFLDSERDNGSDRNVVINLQVGETELASVLLNLNKKGFRVA